MRMKKSILLSLLAIIALGLGACSNSSNNKQANGKENSAQKKTSQSSSKTKDIDSLLEEIQTANEKMSSVRQKPIQVACWEQQIKRFKKNKI